MRKLSPPLPSRGSRTREESERFPASSRLLFSESTLKWRAKSLDMVFLSLFLRLILKLDRRPPESGLLGRGLWSIDFRRKTSLNLEVVPSVGGVRMLSWFRSSSFELLFSVLVDVLLTSTLRRSLDRGRRGDGDGDGEAIEPRKRCFSQR